jgi:hypothetical protein
MPFDLTDPNIVKIIGEDRVVEDDPEGVPRDYRNFIQYNDGETDLLEVKVRTEEFDSTELRKVIDTEIQELE